MSKKIGISKSKILTRLVEAYTNKEKKQIKEIISLLKENKDYRDLYVFYEEIENKYFKNISDATRYLDEIIPLLETKYKNTLDFLPRLNDLIGDVEYETNPLYENLDILLSKPTIHNIDSKIIAKEKLIKHLTTEKLIVRENKKVVTNEHLLFATLSNVFNMSFENQLNEEEKKRLKTIMSMSSNDIKENVSELQETILEKVSNLLTENSDPELSTKLEIVKEEVENILPTRFNLVKLETLKDGLV